jgi:hypothetical protein
MHAMLWNGTEFLAARLAHGDRLAMAKAPSLSLSWSL